MSVKGVLVPVFRQLFPVLMLVNEEDAPPHPCGAHSGANLIISYSRLTNLLSPRVTSFFSLSIQLYLSWVNT